MSLALSLMAAELLRVLPHHSQGQVGMSLARIGDELGPSKLSSYFKSL